MKESLVIRKLRLEDLDAVTEIHANRFAEARSTSLGRPFVRKMYRWFVTKYPDLSLVAAADGRVIGFAVGSLGGYGRRVFRYALPEVLWGLARRPRLIFRAQTFQLWRSLLRGLLPSRERRVATSGDGGGIQAWFATLAVSQEAQGAGLLLIVAFESAAMRQGAAGVSGTVLRDNVLLQRIYESRRWRRAAEGPESITYFKDLSARTVKQEEIATRSRERRVEPIGPEGA